MKYGIGYTTTRGGDLIGDYLMKHTTPNSYGGRYGWTQKSSEAVLFSTPQDALAALMERANKTLTIYSCAVLLRVTEDITPGTTSTRVVDICTPAEAGEVESYGVSDRCGEFVRVTGSPFNNWTFVNGPVVQHTSPEAALSSLQRAARQNEQTYPSAKLVKFLTRTTPATVKVTVEIVK